MLQVVVDMQVGILKGSDHKEDTLLVVVDMLLKGRLLGDTLLEEDSLVLGIHLEGREVQLEGREVLLDDALDMEIYLFHLTHHHLFYCSC